MLPSLIVYGYESTSQKITISSEFTNQNILSSETLEWGNMSTSIVNDVAILGGLNVCAIDCNISKHFSIEKPGTPNYFSLVISLNFYLIGYWPYVNFGMIINEKKVYSSYFIGTNKSFHKEILVPNFQSKTFELIIFNNLKYKSLEAGIGFRNLSISINTCDSTCLTCSDSQDNCTSCYPDADLKENSCHCKEGTYAEIDKDCVIQPCTICKFCYFSCETCYGPNENDCLSCNKGYVLKNNQCYIESLDLIYGYKSFFTENSISLDNNKIFDYWYFHDSPHIIRCIKEEKDILITKNLKNLFVYTMEIKENHINVIIEFNLFIFGNWNETNFFSIQNDDKIIYERRFFPIKKNDYCDNDIIDKLYIKKNFTHSEKKLMITLFSNNSEAFWGIRNFVISIITNPVLDCKEGYYNDDSLLCRMCHSNCKTCSGPGKTNCLSCFFPLYLKDSQCIADSSYSEILISEFFNETSITMVDASVYVVSNFLILENFCRNYKILSPSSCCNIDFSINYQNLQAHYQIIIELDFYNINLKKGEYIKLYIDDNNYIQFDQFIANQNCINNFENTKVIKRFDHSSDILKFSIFGILNEIGAWGVRNFKISLIFCPSQCKTCTEYNVCLSCYPNANLINKNCSCKIGYYEGNNGLDKKYKNFFCEKCHFSCKNCIGPGSNQCLTCPSISELINGFCITPDLENGMIITYDFYDNFPKEELHKWNISQINYKNSIINGISNIYKNFNLTLYPPFYKANFNFSLISFDNINSEKLMVLVNNQIILTRLIENTTIISFFSSNFIFNFSIILLSDSIRWGIRDFYLQILKCDKSCESCFGPLNSDCKICYPFAELIDGKCVCKNGFFYQENKEHNYPGSWCNVCDRSCKTCNGGKNNNCTSCRNDHYLFNNTCLKKEEDKNIEFINNSAFDDEFTSKICNNYFKIYTGFEHNDEIIINNTYKNLKPHYSAKITFNLFKFLERESEESLKLQIDNNFNIQMLNLSEEKTTNFCIPRNSEFNLITIFSQIEIIINHYNSDFSFQLSSNLKETKLYFWGISNLVILYYKCSENCKNCTGPLLTECTSCEVNYFLIKNTCSLTCEHGYYKNSELQICQKCDPLCHECYSYSFDNCLKCRNGLILFNSKCINECPKGYYSYFDIDLLSYKCVLNENITCSEGFYTVLDENNLSVCLKCDSSCKNCSGGLNTDCLSCFKNKYLNNNGTCLKNCEQGFFENKINNTCLKCNSMCKTCFGNDSNSCLSCFPEYFKLNNSCIKTEEVQLELIEYENPNLFSIKLFKEWDIIYNFKDYIDIEIEGVNIENFEYTITVENKREVYIDLNFYTNISNNIMKLSIEKPYEETSLSQYNMNNYSFIINLNDFIMCDTDHIYDNKTKNCQKRNYDNPIYIKFQETQYSTKFILKISNYEISLINQIKNYIDFKIEGIQLDNYYYNISISNDIHPEIIFDFYFNCIIIGNPKLSLILSLPKRILNKIPNPIIIINKAINLKDIYIISENEKKVIENANEMNNIGNMFATSGIIASLLIVPTFGPIKILMIFNIMSFIKFVNINYPPNMQKLFEEKEFKLPFLIFNFFTQDGVFIKSNTISEDNYFQDINIKNDHFKKYDVDLYFINNFGDSLIQFIVVFILALFLLFLIHKFKTKNKIIVIILELLCKFLVWSWILTFFISNFKNIIFFILRSWVFNNFNTMMSKIDLFCSLSCTLICIFLILHVYTVNSVVKKLRNDKKKKESIIEPNQIEFNSIIETNRTTNRNSPRESIKNLKEIRGDISSKLRKVIINLKEKALQNNDEKETSEDKKEITPIKVLRKKTSIIDDIKEDDMNEISINVMNESNKQHSPRTSITIARTQGKDKLNSTIEEKNSFNSRDFLNSEINLKKKIEKKESKFLENFKNVENKTKFKSIITKIYDVHNENNYLKRYSFMSKEYKSESLFQINFLIIELLKMSLYSLIIVVFYKTPILQIGLIIFINFYFVCIVIIYRPFKSKIKLFFETIQEIIVTFCMFLIGILAYKDFIGDWEPKSRFEIGRLFLEINNTLVLFSMAGIIIISIIKGVKIIKKFKDYIKSKIKN